MRVEQRRAGACGQRQARQGVDFGPRLTRITVDIVSRCSGDVSNPVNSPSRSVHFAIALL